MPTQEQIASKLAPEFHRGETRRDGKTPYVQHILQVVANTRVLAPMLALTSEQEMDTLIAAAWLHDSLEHDDADLIGQRIRIMQEEGISPQVYDIVSRLTRQPHDIRRPSMYDTYIRQVADDPHACTVKVADILANLSDDPTPSQVKRYSKALLVLLSSN